MQATATPATPPAAPILTGAVDAARRLGISRSLFLSFARQGIAPPAVRLGRRCLWRVSDLEQWAASGCKRWGA